jgi:hypothetical protein
VDGELVQNLLVGVIRDERHSVISPIVLEVVLQFFHDADPQWHIVIVAN